MGGMHSALTRRRCFAPAIGPGGQTLRRRKPRLESLSGAIWSAPWTHRPGCEEGTLPLAQQTVVEKEEQLTMSRRATICQVLHSLRMGGAEVLAARLARQLGDTYRFVFACLDEIGTLGQEL